MLAGGLFVFSLLGQTALYCAARAGHPELVFESMRPDGDGGGWWRRVSIVIIIFVRFGFGFGFGLAYGFGLDLVFFVCVFVRIILFPQFEIIFFSVLTFFSSDAF
jgi:hypothetical protein